MLLIRFIDCRLLHGLNFVLSIGNCCFLFWFFPRIDTNFWFEFWSRKLVDLFFDSCHCIFLFDTFNRKLVHLYSGDSIFQFMDVSFQSFWSKFCGFADRFLSDDQFFCLSNCEISVRTKIALGVAVRYCWSWPSKNHGRIISIADSGFHCLRCVIADLKKSASPKFFDRRVMSSLLEVLVAESWAHCWKSW